MLPGQDLVESGLNPEQILLEKDMDLGYSESLQEPVLLLNEGMGLRFRRA